MLRVLHVAESGRGGVPAFIRNVCHGLDGDFTFGIACPDHSDLALDPPPAATIYPLQVPRSIRPVADLRASNRLRTMAEGGEYDVVHLNSTKAGILSVPWRGRLRAKTVFTPHALRSHAYPQGSIRRRIALFIEKRICDAADMVVACSRAEAERIITEELAPSRKVRVIDNGVNVAGLSAPSTLKRGDIGVPKKAFVIGTVARLSPQKDPETFVHAASAVASRLPDAHFVMAGDGPLHTTISALVTELGLADRFHLLGWRDDGAEVLKLLDVFVLTSRYEGGPFVILEAAAASKPIVACDSPGIRTLVEHRISGLLARPGDPTAVAAAVLDIHKDEKMAQRLAAEAFQRIASPRRLEVMVDAWGALYRSLVEDPVAARTAQPAQRRPA